MTDVRLDFDGADRTRAGMIEALRASGIDADVVTALSQPGVPDAFLAHPFQAVSDLGELRGGELSVDVPLAWRAGVGARAEHGEGEGLRLLYRQLLTGGTREEQGSLMNRDRLVEYWPTLSREVHPAVAAVWEQRFPELLEVRRHES